MAKIIRYDGDVKPFGVNATGTERTVFGSPSAAPVQSDTLDANINADYLLGWEKIAPGAKPPKQYFNGALFTATQLNAYLHQIGIAEWNGGQEYQIDSFTNRNGVLYRCKTTDHTSVTPPESDAVNWELGINLASETVAGISEIATQAETESGVDDARFITPKKLSFGFSISLTQTGFIAFPSWMGGLIIQWGRANGGSGNTVTLPISFATEVFTVFTLDISSVTPPPAQLSITNRFDNNTLSSLYFDYLGGTGTDVAAFNWFAIGH